MGASEHHAIHLFYSFFFLLLLILGYYLFRLFVRLLIYLKNLILQFVQKQKAKTLHRVLKNKKNLSNSEASLKLKQVELSELIKKEECKQLARQIENQAIRAIETFTIFKDTVHQKFRNTPITQSRFIGASAEVYETILAKVIKSIEKLKFASTLEANKAKSELMALQKLKSKSPTDAQHIKILMERLERFENICLETEELVLANEETILAMATFLGNLSDLSDSTEQILYQNQIEAKLQDLANRMEKFT